MPKTENILEGILVLDFEGKVLYCNESAAKMFGYDTAEEGVGESIYNFLTPKYRNVVAENMARIFRGEWGFLAPYKVRTEYGKELWVESLGQKITYEGRPAELVVLRDITERKKMEIALRKARGELERKVEERTSELKTANLQLKQEVIERKKAQEGL